MAEKNPWLKIPASDYDNHMAHPDVGQSPFLGEVFKYALEVYDATTVALLGSATGNGLEHVMNETTRRLTAVDINREYLDILENRFGKSIDGLSVTRADLETCWLEKECYSLVFAGLIFEYLEPGLLLEKIHLWLKKGGVLQAVLQLAEKNKKRVSPSPYKSLEQLKSLMKLFRPNEFDALAEAAGFAKTEGKIVRLRSGKSFYSAAYGKK